MKKPDVPIYHLYCPSGVLPSLHIYPSPVRADQIPPPGAFSLGNQCVDISEYNYPNPLMIIHLPHWCERWERWLDYLESEPDPLTRGQEGQKAPFFCRDRKEN